MKLAAGLVLTIIGGLLMAPHIIGDAAFVRLRSGLDRIGQQALRIADRILRSLTERYIAFVLGVAWVIGGITVWVFYFRVLEVLVGGWRFLTIVLSLWLVVSLITLLPFIYHFCVRLYFDRFRPIFDYSDPGPLLVWSAVAFPTLIPFGIAVVAVFLAAFLAFSPLLVLWLILTRATMTALYLLRYQFRRAVEATGLAMMVVGAWLLATD